MKKAFEDDLGGNEHHLTYSSTDRPANINNTFMNYCHTSKQGEFHTTVDGLHVSILMKAEVLNLLCFKRVKNWVRYAPTKRLRIVKRDYQRSNTTLLGCTFTRY